MQVKMTVDEALELADLWTSAMSFHKDSQGWRVVCMLLAREVRGLREQLADMTNGNEGSAADLIERDAEIERLENRIEFMGTWPPGSHKAFVQGAKWWQFHKNGSTAFASEHDEMESEAVRRFGPPAEPQTNAAEMERMQARIDSLMLEHCPDEMTPEQVATWERDQRPAPQWQPIETAPKDGTQVLVVRRSGQMRVDWRVVEDEAWNNTTYDDPITGWMPLPSPPTVSGAAQP